MPNQYNIFISYRHSDTADKAEHLHSLLEGAGYKGQVSFDRENLEGRFDLEILRRLDDCMDFLAVIGLHTLDGITQEETEWYERLAVCSVEEFPALEAQTIEAKIERMKAEGLVVTNNDRHIDFVRLELARAIAKNKNIIPIVPVKAAGFDFNTLSLPKDIVLLTKYHAVMYQDSKDFMFRDSLPHILNRIKTKAVGPTPNPWIKVKWVAGITALLVAISALYGMWRWNNEKQEFTKCLTLAQYEALQQSAWFMKGACQDSIRVFNMLRGSGFAAINDSEGTDRTDSVKVLWSEECSLLQMRAIKQIVNNMMLVPNGAFVMATDEPLGHEGHKHNVSIVKDFYIGKFEVSEWEWNAVMRNVSEGDNDLPMTDISWEDCQQFVRKLQQLTGRLVFRLPTEEQWEYAARYGEEDGWEYAGGDLPEDVASFAENTDGKPSRRGKHTPNALELYDMSGNVAEWCTNDNADAEKQMVRGGSYNDDREMITTTFADAVTSDSRLSQVGMRLVLLK